MAFKANNVKVGNKTVASPSGGGYSYYFKKTTQKTKNKFPPSYGIRLFRN